MIATRPITGNGNVAAKTGNIYISGTVADRIEISTANLGFSITYAKLEKLSRAIATTTNNWKYIRFKHQSCCLDCPSLSQSLCNTFVELDMVENPEFVVDISTLSVTVLEI